MALATILLAAGCGGSDLAVSDAWARDTPAVADTAAIYMTITNESGLDQEVSGATSDRCESVEIHETTMAGDAMEMGRLDALAVPEGGTVRLEPGGLHLMCIGLEDPLLEGDTLTLVLGSRPGGSMSVEVVVEDR